MEYTFLYEKFMKCKNRDDLVYWLFIKKKTVRDMKYFIIRIVKMEIFKVLGIFEEKMFMADKWLIKNKF